MTGWLLVKKDDVNRNFKRLRRADERSARSLVILGLLISSNSIVTNVLGLCGYPDVAHWYAVLAGGITIIVFVLQSGLFDSLEPA